MELARGLDRRHDLLNHLVFLAATLECFEDPVFLEGRARRGLFRLPWALLSHHHGVRVWGRPLRHLLVLMNNSSCNQVIGAKDVREDCADVCYHGSEGAGCHRK